MPQLSLKAPRTVRLSLDTLNETLERLNYLLSEHQQSSLVLHVQIAAIIKSIKNHPDSK